MVVRRCDHGAAAIAGIRSPAAVVSRRVSNLVRYTPTTEWFLIIAQAKADRFFAGSARLKLGCQYSSPLTVRRRNRWIVLFSGSGSCARAALLESGGHID